MRERAEDIGGRFSVMSRCDHGTTVRIVVPV
jgi:signal transduction histidine kinase